MWWWWSHGNQSLVPQNLAALFLSPGHQKHDFKDTKYYFLEHNIILTKMNINKNTDFINKQVEEIIKKVDQNKENSSWSVKQRSPL